MINAEPKLKIVLRELNKKPRKKLSSAKPIDKDNNMHAIRAFICAVSRPNIRKE